MKLENNFVTNILNLHPEKGRKWLSDLPSYTHDLSEKLNFKISNIFPNLMYNFVCLVELANKQKAVLKISMEDRIVSEIRWLQYFADITPEIYYADEENKTFLMEHLDPGESLKSIVIRGDDELATRIIAETIRKLKPAHQSMNNDFKSLSELASDFNCLEGHLDKYYLSKAISLFRDLSSSRNNETLLHGDLHHDNILKHGNRWKVIDPHGYMGDPTAEVGAMIRNPYDCFPSHKSLKDILDTRLKILIEELPFDPKRIKAWAYCITILSAAWTLQDQKYLAPDEFELALTLEKIKI